MTTETKSPQEIQHDAMRDTAAWLMRTRDELEYYGILRRDSLPLPSLANLRLALDYAQMAHNYATHGNLTACQAGVDRSMDYYRMFSGDLATANAELQRKANADSESQRAAIAQAQAEKEPVVVNVEVPLTVNPVINRTGMRVERDGEGRVSGIVPANAA